MNLIESISLISNEAIYWIGTLTYIGFGISTIEKLADFRSYSFQGVFSWQVNRTISKGYFQGPSSRFLSLLMDYPNFLVVQILLVIVCGLLLFPFDHMVRLVLLSILVIGLLIDNFRASFGNDGSDQLFSILIICLFISELFIDHSAIQKAIFIFLAAQSCLSYLTSGVVKARGKKWTSGIAVFAIFNTKTYGFKPIAIFLNRYPFVSKFLSWAVIIFELAFPIVLILPLEYALILLVIGVIFHFMNAIIMGLNSFVWAFVATYPAVIIVNTWIQAV